MMSDLTFIGDISIASMLEPERFVYNQDDDPENLIEFAMTVKGETRPAVMMERDRAEWLLELARKIDAMDGPGAYENCLHEVSDTLRHFWEMKDGWLDPLP